MRLILAVALLISSLGALVAPSIPASAADCRFVLGFKALHDAIPDIVGDCLVNEHFNAQNGDSLQETTGTRTDGRYGGLLVWRKADNWTAFTDGYRTWINGPYGVQQRLNTERFEWENDGAAGQQAPKQQPQAPVSGASSAPPEAGAPTSGVYLVHLTRKSDNLYVDENSGVLFFTHYCYEYVYGEEAFYNANRQRLQFDSDTCDVAEVVTRYFEATISGTFNGWEGDTVFRLTNGQIWQQASYSYRYHYAYMPKVLIYEANGLTWMKVQDVEEPVRVRRIK